MSQQVIQRAERIKVFLREYFLGNALWRNVVRIIGGPLILISGLRFYHKPDKFAVAYGGFCFLYGLYFTLKPLLYILLRPILFKYETFELRVTNHELKWIKTDSETTLKFSAFKRIALRSDYYRLDLPDGVTTYILAKQLTEEERSILNSYVNG